MHEIVLVALLSIAINLGLINNTNAQDMKSEESAGSLQINVSIDLSKIEDTSSQVRF